MAGLLDIISAATGHPDPTMALLQRFGQAPGQGVNPTPLPGASQPGAGGPQGAGATQTANGGQTTASAAPSPSAYQPVSSLSTMQQALAQPGDLMRTYMDMQQRQYANEGFNRGLAMFLGGMSKTPGEPQMLLKAAEGMTPDAGQTMGNMMKLYQMQYEMQQQAMMMKVAPALAKQMFGDDSPDNLLKAQAIIASGKYGDIEANLAGVGGSPAWQAQVKAEKALTSQGKPIPWTPGDPASYAAYSGAETLEARNAAEAKDAATTSFGKIMPTLSAAESNIEWLADPKHRDAVITAITTPAPTSGAMGKGAAVLSGITGVNSEVLTARSKIEWLKKQLYAERFAGTKNVRSNTEANNLGASASNLDTITNDPQTIADELERLKRDTYTAIANLHAGAGKQIPSKYSGLADRSFLERTKPNGERNPFYTGASEAEAGAGAGESAAGGAEKPPTPGARRAADGKWYVPDPARPGKYLRVD